MAKWRDTFKKWLASKTNLPADALLDLPRVTMIGQLHIYIENHKGVVHFSDDELRLALNKGQQMKVKGENFVIKTILPEELLLEGKISCVEYIDGKGS